VSAPRAESAVYDRLVEACAHGRGSGLLSQRRGYDLYFQFFVDETIIGQNSATVELSDHTCDAPGI